MHLVNIQLPAQRISCPVPTPQMRVNPPRAGLSLLRYLRLVLETNDHTKRSILSCRNVIPILLCWRYIGNKCKPLNSPVYKLSPACRLLYRCQKLLFIKNFKQYLFQMFRRHEHGTGSISLSWVGINWKVWSCPTECV